MKASTGFRLFICAAEPGGCDAFAWPIATELQWMKATDNEAVASGAKLATPPEKAIALTLQPMSAVTFPVAPTSRRKGQPERLWRHRQFRRCACTRPLPDYPAGRRMDRRFAERHGAPILRAHGQNGLRRRAQKRALRNRPWSVLPRLEWL
jgi:hypothetical protein